MIVRRIIVGVALLAAALPAVAARADGCPTITNGTNDIVIFTGGLNLGAYGCIADWVVLGGSDDPVLGTDYLTPGANTISVRFLQPIRPLDGVSTLSFSGIQGCANPCPLTFTAVTTLGSTVYDSQTLTITEASSLTGGAAVADLCWELDQNGDCIEGRSKTYTSVA